MFGCVETSGVMGGFAGGASRAVNLGSGVAYLQTIKPNSLQDKVHEKWRGLRTARPAPPCSVRGEAASQSHSETCATNETGLLFSLVPRCESAATGISCILQNPQEPKIPQTRRKRLSETHTAVRDRRGNTEKRGKIKKNI